MTQPLPWIDGGRPDVDLTWIGGTPHVYEPGSTIVVDDREVADVVHCLEATDDAGRVVLERARAAIEAPAKRTLLTDLHPSDRAWLIRATDEKLRQQGRLQELVVRMLQRDDHPSVEDLVAALRADRPAPKALIDYVVKVFTKPQRPGPKHPRRTTWQDLAIKAYYEYQKDQARQAHEANSRKPRAVADVAKQATATAFGISKRTVERVLALGPSRLKRPPV